jgi:organic hydroperoxide reductase OsmC/OhrA
MKGYPDDLLNISLILEKAEAYNPKNGIQNEEFNQAVKALKSGIYKPPFWNGTGKEGAGSLNSQSMVLNSAQYGFRSRFEGGIGANSKELIAAAHAGCLSMKLAFKLQTAVLQLIKLKQYPR